MSNSTNTPTDLWRPALDMIVDLFFATFMRPINRDFVEFSLDVATSELVITSKEESASGEVGIYKGSYRWPYLKANLSLVLPHPLAVEVAYPLTFRQLRQQLLTRYQINLEEGEVALTVGGPGLMDNDNITTPLINQYAQFHLYATAQSGRFQTGSRMSLIFLQPGGRVPLRGLLDTIHSNPLAALVGG
jgi:hypothetical protein